MTTGQVTEALVELVTDTDWEDLPGNAREITRQTIGNAAALAVGAASHEAAETVVRTLRRLGRSGATGVLGRDERWSPFDAAALMGLAIHVEDFDDTHLPTVLHPGPVIVPAALAAALSCGEDGRRVARAVALGTEVAVRLGNGICPDHFDRGWHVTGTTGHVGAAVAAGVVLGLDPERLRHAIAIAATQAAGLTEALGTMTKALHPGRAAAHGVQAAVLAGRGLTGPDEPLIGPGSFAHLTSPRVDPAAMLAGAGHRWELELNAFKPYACGIVSHPVLDAAVSLRGAVGPDRIDRVEVVVNPVVLAVMGKTDPRSGLESKFSVYHCFAVGFLDGAGGPPEFSDARAVASDVRALRSRVNVVTTPEVPKGAAQVSVVDVDGREYRTDVTHATGSAERPMTAEQLSAKATALVRPVLGDRTAEFLERAFALDDEASPASWVELSSPSNDPDGVVS